jgi:single-stranded-DNA-specific exonuclease
VLKATQEIANHIQDTDEIHIVTHIDADGITAGAIAKSTLERIGIEHSIEFVQRIDEPLLEKLRNQNKTTWFMDMGSGMISQLSGLDYIITDHHLPQKTLPSQSSLQESYHLNPHLHGIDGTREISGAGVTYLVSRALDKKNRDLAHLAIVGAMGDGQDSQAGYLEGFNRDILQDGKTKGFMEWHQDIRYFGRSTRPVCHLLQFADDPLLPYLSGNQSACISFLTMLDIPLKEQNKWRRWTDLTKGEKRAIISHLIQLLISKGFGYYQARRIIGEVYVLVKEEQGTPLRDAKEYATLLNSTGRYENAWVGLHICLGDREKYLRQAKNLLQSHRRHLAKGLHLMEREIVEQEYIQFFHGGSKIKETIVGSITGMFVHSERVRKDLPLIGLVDTDNGEIKVSARASRHLLIQGVNLSQALGKAASALGGQGGGHDIAAGATIPRGTEQEFLGLAEQEIKNQLTS